MLAVDPDDLDQVLTDLEAQATKGGVSTSRRRAVPLARGGSVAVVSLIKASDEDYGCRLLASPDRARILVTSQP